MAAAAVGDDGDEAAEARVADPVGLLVGRLDRRRGAHHPALPLPLILLMSHAAVVVLFHPLQKCCLCFRSNVRKA